MYMVIVYPQKNSDIKENSGLGNGLISLTGIFTLSQSDFSNSKNVRLSKNPIFARFIKNSVYLFYTQKIRKFIYLCWLYEFHLNIL